MECGPIGLAEHLSAALAGSYGVSCSGRRSKDLEMHHQKTVMMEEESQQLIRGWDNDLQAPKLG